MGCTGALWGLSGSRVHALRWCTLGPKSIFAGTVLRRKYLPRGYIDPQG